MIDILIYMMMIIVWEQLEIDQFYYDNLTVLWDEGRDKFKPYYYGSCLIEREEEEPIFAEVFFYFVSVLSSISIQWQQEICIRVAEIVAEVENKSK